MIDCRCQDGIGYWQNMQCRPLTQAEERRAYLVAKERHDRSWTRRSKDRVNPKSKQKDFATHLLGARAELAYCILEGVEWPATVDDFKNPDVPPDIEIRCRNHKWRNIIIRDNDIKKGMDRRFVAGRLTEEGVFQFDGWLWGHEAIDWKREDPGGYGAPARFIPVSRLHRLPFYRNSKRAHTPNSKK